MPHPTICKMTRLIWISLMCVGVVGMVRAQIDRYRMTRSPRGTCVIISNEKFEPRTGQENRVGANVDALAIRRAFMALGFTIEMYTDLRKTAMMNVVRDAAKNWRNSDAFVMVIMTSGDERGLWAVDQPFHIDTILKRFKTQSSWDLAGKPKLFFVEAPRGSRYDSGVRHYGDRVKRAEGDSGVSNNTKPCREKRAVGDLIPVEADFLVAYSTSPGYYSWMNRISESGAWFIQALSRMLMLHGKSMDLLKILTRTSFEVATTYESMTPNLPNQHLKKQQPQIVSMLTKDVYF